MLLLGMSIVEWEKRAREAKDRRAEAEQTRLRLILSSVSESEQARPKPSSFGRLVAAMR